MNNKNVLLTGATKGIGLQILKSLIKAGYRVFISGRDKEKLNELTQKYPENIVGYYSEDLTFTNSCSNLFTTAKEKLGTVDILINNAGEYIYSPIEKMQKSDVERLIKLNFEVPYLLSQHAVAGMKNENWGRIVNIGSISGAVGEANATLYSSTKAALIGLTKALALEVAADSITVNIINPGWVNTELTKNALENDECSESECLEMIPQRRFIEPQEVADLTLYLISDSAKGITGQYLNICAGLSIG